MYTSPSSSSSPDILPCFSSSSTSPSSSSRSSNVTSSSSRSSNITSSSSVQLVNVSHTDAYDTIEKYTTDTITICLKYKKTKYTTA
ncbi:unnamed protein product [Adineta steineri]|uniref:Uncharacterized protein n=1 Tax=Adineta steineri TaxID=433720 RepID=A0A818W2N4_9BILA|nr:unnamed protein product [Adineta steineri]